MRDNFHSNGIPEQREAGTFIWDGESIFKRERWHPLPKDVVKYASTYTAGDGNKA